jgi:hypothetical protein
MKDDDNNTIDGSDLNRITKVAYRPEKNKDCMVIWQSIKGVIFERSYYYTNYDDAKIDYMNIKMMFEAMETEEVMINE